MPGAAEGSLKPFEGCCIVPTDAGMYLEEIQQG